MKWVLKTSNIIVGNENGKSVFRSEAECPEEVRQMLRETLPGPNAATIVITNREALEAIQSNAVAVPRRSGTAQPRRKSGLRGFVPYRWQLVAAGILLAVVTLTAILVWAINNS